MSRLSCYHKCSEQYEQDISSYLINSLHAGYLYMFCFLSSVDFFKLSFFKKILSGIPLACQTVWIQIRPDVLSGLIWVQTVCRRQKSPLAGKELTKYSDRQTDLQLPNKVQPYQMSISIYPASHLHNSSYISRLLSGLVDILTKKKNIYIVWN